MLSYTEAYKIAIPFCSASREILRTPAYNGGGLYASNGRMAVRMDVGVCDVTEGHEKFPFAVIDEIFDSDENIAKRGAFDPVEVDELAKQYFAELAEWRVREAGIVRREREESMIECPHCGKTFHMVAGDVVSEATFQVDDANFDFVVAVDYGEEWDLFNFRMLLNLVRNCGEDAIVDVISCANWMKCGRDSRAAVLRVATQDRSIETALIGMSRPAYGFAHPEFYSSRGRLVVR